MKPLLLKGVDAGGWRHVFAHPLFACEHSLQRFCIRCGEKGGGKNSGRWAYHPIINIMAGLRGRGGQWRSCPVPSPAADEAQGSGARGSGGPGPGREAIRVIIKNQGSPLGIISYSPWAKITGLGQSEWARGRLGTAMPALPTLSTYPLSTSSIEGQTFTT